MRAECPLTAAEATPIGGHRIREVPDRPDLDQLRRQARELRRAAAAGEQTAIDRLRAVSAKPTLWGAQLALAREHGFPSWPRLKAEAERRSASGAGDLVIRPVTSLAELTSVFDLAGAQVTPSIHTRGQALPGDLGLARPGGL